MGFEGNSDTEELRVLVVDDEDTLRSSLSLNLKAAGYHVHAAKSIESGQIALTTDPFDIILCDYRLPDGDGLQFIERCREIRPSTAVIFMTAFGNTDLALEALRKGAYDYISKPFEVEELIFTLRKVEEREKLRQENETLKSQIDEKYNFSNIVAQSKSMRDIFETVKRLAAFNTTVLITGESGTGKELLAQAIHHNSPRSGKRFIAINCGAIPETLMETELFGHVKGAFTDAGRDKKGLFEEADGGTLFLDEIGEMSPHLQVKLLRALQEKQIRRVGDEKTIDIDVRVITATLRNLEEDVENGKFREDLFYRLNVVSLPVPALRERPEDIPVLVDHFLKKHCKRLGMSRLEVQPEALKTLMSYHWRGNVRELENCIEHSIVLTETGTIDLASLPPQIRAHGTSGEHEAQEEDISDEILSIKQRTRSLEISLIKRALRETSGNRTRAAKILEISHRALLYKLKEYNLTEFK